MPCTCLNPKPVFTFYCTVVCTNCGIETNSQIISPSDDTTYNSSQCKPLNNRLYNRPDRWKSLVRKVVGIHSGPPRHDPVWNYLKTYNDTTPISTVSDIYTALRLSKLKHKHYQCAHAFSKCFAKNYTTPKCEPIVVEKHLNSYFKHIQYMWNKGPKDFFFSYAWLLEQGLCVFSHTEYLPYVKTLICKRRRNKYVQVLLTLYKTHAKMLSRGSSNTRSQNVLSHSQIHHSLQSMRQRPVENSPSELDEEQTVSDSEPCPVRKYVRLLGGSQMYATCFLPLRNRREQALYHLENHHSDYTPQAPRRTTRHHSPLLEDAQKCPRK